MAQRDFYVIQGLGHGLAQTIKDARVLMVGAGGIGCELLKNLVLTGFGEIHVVDLDTIDLSNLNRQFLFSHEHIKKAKALVAKESAGKFNPNVKIEAYHANIKDAQFDVDFFKQFNVVFNALDNVDARRHLNRMCIAADVPQVDSGTTGFHGHAQVIVKGVTACYECYPKEAPKSYPVCTIRSTPSQPIHCIVWAKSYLFTEIFNVSEEQVPELDFSEDSENAKEIEKLREEAAALKKIRESMGSDNFARLIFQKVFTDDIERLRSMDDMWKSRSPPTPLSFDELSQEAKEMNAAEIVENDQTAWSLAQNFAVFVDSLQRLSKRMEDLKAAGDAQPILSFDKDDDDALDFVAATANLRSHIFGIDVQSEFEIKRMAGNIIPAIATTNAIIAGLSVLQSFKVLRGPEHYREAVPVFNAVGSTERRLSSDAKPPAPNPNCPVCSTAWTQVKVNPERSKLGDLVDKLKDEAGYTDEMTVMTGDARIVYEPDLDDNLSKSFKELAIAGGSILTVTDEREEDGAKVNLMLSIKESPEMEELVQLTEELKIPVKQPPPKEQSVLNAVASPLKKMKRKADDAELENENPKKKGKAIDTDDDDLVMLADPPDGTIVID